MTRKQMVQVVVIVLVASAISALVAYGCGVKRSRVPSPAAGAASERENRTCVAFTEASSLLGKSGCVTGRVLRVFTSRAGNTFLDFCPDYRTCPFTSVVFDSDRSKFGDLGTLAGRQVEIRGLVESYEGHAEIIIRDPDQIRVLP
jgi:DNA/RNA endonuclease YhcR with UshA esterase domain